MYLVLCGESLDDLDIVGLAAVLGEDDVFGLGFLVLGFDGFAHFVDALRQQRIRV